MLKFPVYSVVPVPVIACSCGSTTSLWGTRRKDGKRIRLILIEYYLIGKLVFVDGQHSDNIKDHLAISVNFCPFDILLPLAQNYEGLISKNSGSYYFYCVDRIRTITIVRKQNITIGNICKFVLILTTQVTQCDCY